MFTVKGRVLIQFKDCVTGKIRREVEQDNIVTNVSLLNFVAPSGYIPKHTALAFKDRRISISTSLAVPQRTVSTVPNVIGTGYVPPDVTSPKYFFAANPPYGEIQNRIEQVGFQRNFNTVALTTLGTNSVNDKLQNNLTATNVAAYLLLTVPCTQQPDEILDIFYRIQFVNTLGQNINSNDDFIRDFGCATFLGIDEYYSFARSLFMTTSPVSAPPAGYTRPYWPSNPATDLITNVPTYGSPQNQWSVYTRINDHFKLHARKYLQTTDFVGRIFNCVYHMRKPDTQSALSWRTYNHTSRLQGLFSHRVGATRPFLDVTALALGSGRIFSELPNNNWITSDRWPECVFIDIKQTGNTSTAFYRVRIALSLGFSGNTFTNSLVINPYRNPATAAFPGAIGFNTNKLIAIDSTRVIQYGPTGLNLINVRTGAFRVYDSSSTPALPALNICQVAIRNDLVYVACRQTGLYLINLATNTVQLVNNTPCYGVDFGQNVAYAVFQGRLSNSINWNTPLPFTFAGISDNNWQNVNFIKVDPVDSEGRMAIVTNSPNRIVWHNPSTNVTVAGPNTPGVSNDPMKLAVTNTGSYWLFKTSTNNDGVSRTIFSTTTVVNYPSSVSWDSSGSAGQFPIVITDGDKYFNLQGIRKASDGSLIQGFDQELPDYGLGFAYLGNGIYLSGGYMGVIKYTPHYIKDFGWNGSQWVQNFGADRPVHTTMQSLPNGVNIRFQDGAVEPSFVQGDFYTLFVCDGFWKDNASTASFSFDFYSKPAVTNAPINLPLVDTPAFFPHAPGGSTPDPNFLRIETHSPEGHRLFLNNNPVTTIYVNGEVPGPGEITINGLTGAISYNPANAGMILSGTYVYIRD